MRAYVLLIIAMLAFIAVAVSFSQPIERPLLVTAQPASMIVCNLRQGDDFIKRDRAGRIVKT